MAADIIKVKTEVLVAKAASLQARTSEMRTQFNEMEQMVSRTSNYWLGEAGDKKRKDYQDKKDQIEELLRRLEDYPKMLNRMAGVYSETETGNVNISDALASDAII